MNGHDDPWAALHASSAGGPDDLSAAWSEPEGRRSAASRTHPLIVVVGACGGSGASTVAGGLALSMAAREGAAHLIDLDFAWGDVHGGWGVPRDRTVHDLSAVSGELTSDQIEMILAHHPSGVRLALSPGRPEAAAEWDESAIARLLVQAATGAATVVDTGRVEPRVLLAAGEAAARRLIVAPRTIRGARGVGRALDLLGTRAEVVVNGAVRDADISMRGFRRLVGTPVLRELPRRPIEAEWILAGRRPTGRRRPLRDALDALAQAGGE